MRRALFIDRLLGSLRQGKKLLQGRQIEFADMRRNTMIDNIEKSNFMAHPPDLPAQLQPLPPVSAKPGLKIDYGYRIRHFI